MNGGRSTVTSVNGRPKSAPRICEGSLKIGKSKPPSPEVSKPCENSELAVFLAAVWSASMLVPPSSESRVPPDVKSVKLPAGAAVEIDYTSNSEPDSATTAVRLHDTAYLFFKNGTVGWLTWWAPQGADVSALNRTAKSFKWL